MNQERRREGKTFICNFLFFQSFLVFVFHSILPFNVQSIKYVASSNKKHFLSALSKFLRVVKADIEREKKGKAGVENLARALQETPKFGSEDSQQDVQEKLQHMRSMLTFLEACR